MATTHGKLIADEICNASC